MVRWRWCLVLATLLLLPYRTDTKLEDEEEEEHSDEADEEEDEEDEDEEEPVEKAEHHGRRVPGVAVTPKPVAATRTTKKRPLECYVCAYKAEAPLRACLDPTKFRVHTITCHNLEDKCFTTVIAHKDHTFDAVVRGCRSGCVVTAETQCCDINRCNNQAMAMPVTAVGLELKSHSQQVTSKTTKTIPPTVLFFVTILLVLQTVVKVAFV